MKSKKNFRLKIYNIKRSHQLNETALSRGDSGISLRSTRKTAECSQVLRPISVENTGRGLSPMARICHTGPVDVFIEVEVYGKNHVSYSLLVFGLPCSVMLSCDNEPGVACLHPRRPVQTACVALARATPEPAHGTVGKTVLTATVSTHELKCTCNWLITMRSNFHLIKVFVYLLLFGGCLFK